MSGNTHTQKHSTQTDFCKQTLNFVYIFIAERKAYIDCWYLFGYIGYIESYLTFDIMYSRVNAVDCGMKFFNGIWFYNFW